MKVFEANIRMLVFAANIFATEDEIKEWQKSDKAWGYKIAVHLADGEINESDSDSERFISHVRQLLDINRSASFITTIAQVAVLHAIKLEMHMLNGLLVARERQMAALEITNST